MTFKESMIFTSVRSESLDPTTTFPLWLDKAEYLLAKFACSVSETHVVSQALQWLCQPTTRILMYSIIQILTSVRENQ